MGEPEDVDAMLEEALDKIEDDQKKKNASTLVVISTVIVMFRTTFHCTAALGVFGCVNVDK
ncbi:unnamed protein product [Onchocerca flexuosa]|uniref:Dynein light chain n=1 Tax=Onchocerca flexuosa TaxID=387005 RepID=A0A183I5J6_9BILA|nr:unnamed protein product [Onchocerca flexuosa]